MMQLSRPLPGDHDLRIALSEVMHARSLPLRAAPIRVRQWLILHGQEDPPGLDAWLADKSSEPGAADPRHLTGHSDGCELIWERHTEFSTITAIRSAGDVRAGIDDVSWLGGLPGQIFRSVEILVGRRDDFDWEWEAVFEQSRLVSSHVFDGAARVWSDFTIKGHGGGRILVEDLGLENDEVARLVQTLVEIGNYRKLAILGFPLARELMPWITEIEAEHSAITERHNTRAADSSEILGALLALSSEIELKAAKARLRLGATCSYHLLTIDRLRSLREARVAGFSTAGEFIERRLLPAMRTCEIARRRLERLSERINRTASLLSLEQTILLNRQNQAVLASLNRRSALQLRLQNLVEGFSIFAISYYILTILEKPLKAVGPRAGTDYASALLVIPVVLFTWTTLERGKRRKRANIPLLDSLAAKQA